MKRMWCAVLGLVMVPAGLEAQARPFEIADNSFLVEEAFNQEAGVFQNVFLLQKARAGSSWLMEFTQEWPVRSQRHQFSYTLPYEFDGGGLGDVMLNYRLQARMEDGSGPAFSPRLSVILPTGSDDAFEYGAQVNLPVSRQFGDFYAHANAGATWTRYDAANADRISPHAAGSLIWRMLPLVHPMIEAVAKFEESAVPDGDRTNSVLVAPGVRAAKNFGTHQLVLGAAVPLEVSGGPPASELVLYVSYELPFRKQ